MTDLLTYAAQLDGVPQRGLPPIEKWNPDFCGDIDLVIKRDGAWWYEGSPITRARLVRLFSTILKREGDRYFLVTPVEKLGIVVEDAPFVAVLMNVQGSGRDQSLTFTTNLNDAVTAGAAHPIRFDGDPNHGGYAPYIHVRGGLEARIARAVYYELVDHGETYKIGGQDQIGVWSGGSFFPFSIGDDLTDQDLECDE